MKGLLTFLFVVVLATAALGWFRGWFDMSQGHDANGNPTVTTTIFPDKLEGDLHVAVAKSKDLLVQAEDKIKELKDKSAKAKGDQRSKLERSITELQTKRDALQAQLDQMSKSGSKATQAEKDALARQIDDLNKAIEQAGKH